MTRRLLSLFMLFSMIFSAFGSIVLTESEEEWLERNPEIILAVDDGNAPMNYRDSEGRIVGLSIDYLDLIAKKTGLTIRFEGSDWDTAYRKAVSGETDGIVNATYQEDRLEYFLFTEPYFENPLAFAVGSETPTIESLDDMEGWRIAVITNTIRVPMLKDLFDSVELIEVDTLEEAYKYFVEGKADAIFDDLTVLQHLIQRYVTSDLMIGFLYYAGSLGESRIAVKKNAPELRSIINKGINDISQVEQSKIHQNWLQIARNIGSARRLELSSKEREWLALHPVIRVFADPEHAPFSLLDGETLKGISIDYLNEIEELLDFQFVLYADRTWSEGLEALERREMDLALTVTPTQSRGDVMIFSEPFLQSPYVIYTQLSHPYVPKLDDLDGESVAVVPGTAVETWIRESYPNLIPVKVPNTEEGVIGLSRGDYDLLIDNLLVVNYYMQMNSVTNLKVSGESDLEDNFTFGVRKDWPELASILNKSLDAIGMKRSSQILSNWSQVEYIRRMDWSKLYPYIVIITIVLIIAVLWIWLLITEIRRREIAEAKLIEQQQQLLRSERLSAVGNLVIGLSHEINTPLGICITSASHMSGELDSLIEKTGSGQRGFGAAEGKIKDLVRTHELFRSNLERIVGLIERMRTLGSENQKQSIVEYDLREHLEGIFAMSAEEIKRAGCEVRIDCPENLKYQVYQGILIQVIGNLIENTLKHGFSPGHVNSLISVEVAPDHQGLIIDYKDNGNGIDEETLPLLFDAFYTTKRGEGAAGLGLHIVYQIVNDMLGGRISAYRPVEGGLGFHIVVPPVLYNT